MAARMVRDPHGKIAKYQLKSPLKDFFFFVQKRFYYYFTKYYVLEKLEI